MKKAEIKQISNFLYEWNMLDAGIPAVDDAGWICYFHSLRHSTDTLLADSGCYPKVAQAIMRHSDINLTMSRYSHVLMGRQSEAVEKIPAKQRKAAGRKDRHRRLGLFLVANDRQTSSTDDHSWRPQGGRCSKNAVFSETRGREKQGK